MFVELDNDQRRETVNTRQRYQAWRNAVIREAGYRGSMVWGKTKGHDYLLRSYYDDDGKRRQKSLGRRSEATESIKTNFDSEQTSAEAARKSLDEAMSRQTAINRALGLGRVPLIAARILRLLDKKKLLGHGLKVVGTNALYAYEAAAGVMIDPGITATGDIDLLFDARRTLRIVSSPDMPKPDLLELLRLADRSFRARKGSFRAENDEGFLVDLITPQANPPWHKKSPGALGDIEAAEIEGLTWLENAPAFEQIAIDERGQPLPIVCPDPRVFAIHKLWLSTQQDRDPLKKARDREQALVVARLTKTYLQHLPFNSADLRMLPRNIAESALATFNQLVA